MRRKAIIYLLFGCAVAHAQEATYRYQDAVQLWRTTQNAAGLSLDIDTATNYNRGFAQFIFTHSEGDYHRVQEGGSSNQLGFQTECYQTVGKYLVGYGRFHFNMDHTKDRSWCDVMRPYNANPFISGSSVPGAYDTQTFDFTAALGTVGFGGWRFGIRLDYQVADLSRLRDPRSRSQLLDYQLTPGVTYTTGSHTFGLDANYHRRKEKIPSITTVQNDPNLSYYLFSGMEEASGSVGAYKGFEREWVDHRLGVSLNYAYRGQQLHSLIDLSIERGEEGVYGQYKYEPGKYISYRYQGDVRNRITKGNITHQIDLGFDYEQAYADEYRQQLEQTKDATTGLTSYHYNTIINYKKRYQVKVFQYTFDYRAHFNKNQQETGYAGIHCKSSDITNKHLLPTSSINYGGLLLMGEGGMALTNRLWIDASAGGFLAGDNSLQLADPTTAFAQQVLLPDMQYYDANYWRGRLKLTYQFPITIKGTQTQWFVCAYGDYLRTNNHLESKCIGLSVGLFN